MASLDADRWLEGLLADEGWQAPLEDASRERVVQHLEALLPSGATLEPARAARWQASLRELAELVDRLRAGLLDEETLVAAWLRREAP